MSIDAKISTLNPYNRDQQLVGRIIARSDIRKFNSARGEGCFFTADVMDADGSTIRMKAFGDACNNLYDNIKIGQVYRIARFRVGLANKKFNQGISSEYEVTLENESQVEQQNNTNAIATIPTKNLKTIEELNTVQMPLPADGNQRSDLAVDTLGVVTRCSEATDYTSRAGKEMRTRDMTISDHTLTSIEVKFFGDIADSHTTDQLHGAAVLLRGAKLSEFNGRNLMMGFGSEMHVNPEVPQARDLMAWYERTGKNAEYKPSAAARGTLNDFRDPVPISTVLDPDMIERINNKISAGGNAEYVTIRGYIHVAPLDGERKPWYEACNSGKDCKRKATGQPGSYYCDACSASFTTCKHIYILNFTVYDSSGSRWVSAFGDDAETIIGIPADTLAEHAAAGDTEPLRRASEAVQYKQFLMRVRFRLDAGSLDNNGQPRVRASLVKLIPVDPTDDAEAMLAQFASVGDALSGLQ